MIATKMRRPFATIRLPVAALAMLATTAQAATPPPCINPTEMRGLVGYFLPEVIAEVTTSCAAHLPASAYLVTGLPRMGRQLTEAKNRNWPIARSAFLKSTRGTSDEKRFASLPDKTLRPLVDATMSDKMKMGLTPASCGDVNDVVEALAPLDADQMVNLLATVMNTVTRKDSKMRSCPRETER